MRRVSHGLARDRAAAALLILDMMSDFRFPDGERVARAAQRIAAPIRRLRDRARQAGLAVIYVNDYTGRWRSDGGALLSRARNGKSRGAAVASLLDPGPQDYFILKPRHSAFYATPLAVLLEHLGTERLILTGVSSHQCVLFTANDAHVRNLELWTPPDCIAAPSGSEARFALKYFGSVLGTHLTASTRLRLGPLARASRRR